MPPGLSYAVFYPRSDERSALGEYQRWLQSLKRQPGAGSAVLGGAAGRGVTSGVRRHGRAAVRTLRRYVASKGPPDLQASSVHPLFGRQTAHTGGSPTPAASVMAMCSTAALKRRGALIPSPHLHHHRYPGVLAPNAPLRLAATPNHYSLSAISMASMPEKMLEHLREFSSLCADLPSFRWGERRVRPLRVASVAGAALGTFTSASRLQALRLRPLLSRRSLPWPAPSREVPMVERAARARRWGVPWGPWPFASADRLVRRTVRAHPLAATLVLALGALVLDFAVGQEFHFPLGFLVPVAVAAWMGRPRLAYFLSIGMPLVRVWYYGSWQVPDPWPVDLVNAVVESCVLAFYVPLVRRQGEQARQMRSAISAKDEAMEHLRAFTRSAGTTLQGRPVSPGLGKGSPSSIGAISTLLTSSRCSARPRSGRSEPPRSRVGRLRSRTRGDPHALWREWPEGVELAEVRLAMVSHPYFAAECRRHIQEERLNARGAVVGEISQLEHRLQSLDQSYLTARSADIRDLGRQILRHLADGPRARCTLWPRSRRGRSSSPTRSCSRMRCKWISTTWRLSSRSAPGPPPTSPSWHGSSAFPPCATSRGPARR